MILQSGSVQKRETAESSVGLMDIVHRSTDRRTGEDFEAGLASHSMKNNREGFKAQIYGIRQETNNVSAPDQNLKLFRAHIPMMDGPGITRTVSQHLRGSRTK